MASAEPDTRIMTAAASAAAEAASYTAGRMAVFEERLRTLVGIDSGEDSPEGRERAAELLARWATAAGCDVAAVPRPSGTHVVCTLRGNGAGRVILLGHHDTVYTAGTAAARPMRLAEGLAYGPGVADMKGGLLVALTGLEALAAGPRPFASVELHSVPDEEIRVVPFATIDTLFGADAVLVLECGRENGDFVHSRKTGAWLRLSVEGTPAHAGTEPALGRSAVIGLCHEVLRLSAVNAERPDLTVIAGTVAGGSIANVVPHHAEAVIDVRAATRSDFDWAVEQIGAAGDYEGLTVSLENLGTWPGIEPSASGDRLLATAVELARRQGLDVGGQTSGGMSDGCWTAARGLPTLDGLGPVGGLDHSPAEYIRLDSVPSRCAVVAGLCTAVGEGLLGPVAVRGGEETSEGGESHARPQAGTVSGES